MKIRTSLLAATLMVALMPTAAPARQSQQRPRIVNPSARPGPGKPTIWRDPGLVEQLDFSNGAGGVNRAPRSPYTFVEEDSDGSNPKVKVKDATGRNWIMKWGSEVHAEVFASRVAWASGYWVEPTYYVQSGRVLNVGKVDRARKYIGSDGRFEEARFELKERDMERHTGDEGWRWDRNPFLGTKELAGLKIIMMLTSNWDSKDQRDTSRGSNTGIFVVEKTGAVRYLVTDWGGSMGNWGGVLKREKWDCDGYRDQTEKFIRGVKDGRVEFGYSGQRTDDIREGITVSDVRWLLTYLGRVTDSQLRAGLRASGATPEEISCFTSSIRDRINQLGAVARR